MTSFAPLTTWGMPDHLPSRYCVDCANLSGIEFEKNYEAWEKGALPLGKIISRGRVLTVDDEAGRRAAEWDPALSAGWYLPEKNRKGN